ncbi:MAG: CARDB domain-containing protein [Candidatus Micrarchaeota archaeon]
MNKIDYLILVFFVAVVVVALYIRFTYQPPVNLDLTLSSSNSTIYPFQKAEVQISVDNIGSSNINGMGLEVLVNGNASREYSLTIPSGKEAVFYFNFTPNTYGIYNITAVADPAKLYPIIDRSKTIATTIINVKAPQALEAYAPISSNGLIYLKEANLTSVGALVATFLYYNYSINELNFADLNLPYTLFTSLIGIAHNYISDIGVAYANYSNGSSIYSIWLEGSINQNAILSALQAVNASYTQKEVNGNNVTLAELGKNITLCSWYSNGWIKNIVYKNGSCLSLIDKNYTNPLPNNPAFTKMENFMPNNTVLLADYKAYYFPTNSPYAARILAYSNAVIVPSINQNPVSLVCYGIITNITNQSYCSTYIFQASHKIGKLGLVRTSTFIVPYNFTLFSLVNQSAIISAVPVNINLLKELGANGSSFVFSSGFTNYCNVENFSCINVKFANGQIYFTLKNIMNRSVTINGINCFIGKGKETPANISIAPGSNASLVATCYQNNTIITGIPLGLRVALNVSYVINNERRNALGSAIINFFG